MQILPGHNKEQCQGMRYRDRALFGAEDERKEDQMTANELRDLLIKFCERNGGRNGECVIAVPTANPSVGPKACSVVTHAGHGIDWDAGKLFLFTKDTLVVERPLPMDLSKLAVERLAEIRDAHNRVGFEYMPKAHSLAWCDGFKAGVKEHYTGAPPEETADPVTVLCAAPAKKGKKT